jgi:hypothetical protein
VDDKLKQLLREKLITSLLPIKMSTLTIHVGVPMPLI